MVDAAVFDHKLVAAVHRQRRAAAVDDACEVRVHPYDYEDLALARDQEWGTVRSGNWLAAGDARWRGITVLSDPAIAQGKPELRWREVLSG